MVVKSININPNGATLIVVQFSYSNPDTLSLTHQMALPVRDEDVTKRLEHKAEQTGGCIVEPSERADAELLLNDLDKSGYVLVDAFRIIRLKDQKNPKSKYNVARFIFAHNGSTDFQDSNRNAVLALASLTEQAYWRIRAFRNPLFKDGAAVEGKETISVNFEVRVPISNPDGTPVVQWMKDDKGHRIGQAPLPIEPQYLVTVVAM